MKSSNKLTGKKIAILATDGFEQSELFTPLERLKSEGAHVDIISIKEGKIRGWDKDSWGDDIAVDKQVRDVSASHYNALLLPGGLFNPDALRANKEAVEFVKGFFDKDEQKPVAAICHGPWLLAEADVIKGRELTSFPSIRTDLENAGATWSDSEVICDNGLVTSRKPEDLEAFCDKFVEEIIEGKHILDEAA